MQESLALKLRVLRAEKALTIEQAAELAGVQPETISDAERGRRHPYVPTLRKLAKAYGVPVETLLSQEKLEPVATAGHPKVEVPEESAYNPLFERLLKAHGAVTSLLADDTLLARLEDMDRDEALEVGRVAAEEFQRVTPSLLRHYEEALVGTPEKATASREWTDIKWRATALRWALRAKFETDPTPVPPAVSEEVERVERALAMTG
jgi:transcriptional regulator with XRE-family HTH domain